MVLFELPIFTYGYEISDLMILLTILIMVFALGGLSARLLGQRGVSIHATLLGISITGLVCLAAGSVSLQAACIALVVLAVAGLALEAVRFRRKPHLGSRDPFPHLDLVEWGCLFAISVALIISLVGSLAPVTGWDATVAHLALPMDYVREGRIALIEGNEYSGYPHLAHALFAVAFYAGGETSVALLNWAFAPLACLAAYALGRQLHSRRCGIIAAAILATAPIFFDQAQSPSIDLAFCGFTLAALAGLYSWLGTGRRSNLLLAALLVGSSCGIRHTGYFVAVLLTLGIVVMGRRDSRDFKDCKDECEGGRGISRFAFGISHLANAALFATVAAVAAAPWLIRSALVVGNPVYPFFSSLLGSGDMPHWEVTAIAGHSSVTSTSLVSLLRFPWDLVMQPERFDGWTKSPGGLVLFLGIPGLIVGGRHARALGAFSGAGLVTFFYFQRLARYMLPFLAPMMVLAALACCRMQRLRRVAEGALVVSLVFGLGLGLAAVHFKIPVALGLESRDAYLADRVERYAAFEWVNENVPRDETMLTFDRRTYFIKGRTYQNDEPLRRLANAPVAEQTAWLDANDIEWVFVPVTYLEESPGYKTTLFPMVDRWRQMPESFALVKALDIPRTRSGGTERVEVYRVKEALRVDS